MRLGLGLGLGLTTGRAAPPAAGPAVYRFDSSLADAGVGAKDLSAVSGSAAYGTGKFTGCLGDPTDGASGVTVGRAQDLLAGALDGAAYSVSYWARMANNAGGTGLEEVNVRFLSPGGVELFGVRCGHRTTAGGGFETAQLRFNDGATVTASNNIFAQAAWAHVAASVSGGLAQLWIDGVQKVTNQAVPAGLTFDPAGTFEVVRGPSSGVDDLGVGPFALSQSDVDYLYNSGSGRLYPTPGVFS